MKKYLLSMSRKVLIKEIIFQSTVFFILIILYNQQKFLAFEYPVSLVLLAVSFIAGEHLWEFMTDFYKSTLSRIPNSRETIDFLPVTPPNDETVLQKMKSLLTGQSNAPAIVKAIITISALSKIGYDFFNAIYWWIFEWFKI